MTESIVPTNPAFAEKTGLARFDRPARRAVFALLNKIERGCLNLVEKSERMRFGEKTEAFPLEATLTVHHPRFYGSALFGGSIGVGEAYMNGYWSADNPTDVLRIVLLNRRVFDALDRGWSRLSTPVHRFFHLLRKNTRRGSRDNIVAHYDLGNEFYRLFLDETMTYSCGIFQRPDSTLAEASTAKYERLCRKLALTPGDHLLEIGTGWGGFAVHAAGGYGCRVTTTTISDRQHAFARQRVKAAGLDDRVTILNSDYRELRGRYDKLVSIEMIEAVGHHFLDTFFRVCSRLLKDDGVMALQAITIADQVYDRHKHEVDFIKRYIFPGSCIPSVAAIGKSVACATDLRLFHLEDITPHYARTLRTWRENFLANIDAVKALGFSDVFVRMWEFYLCYCEAGFAEHYIGDVQMILTKPLCRRAPILASLEG
jgi:cyclopropane-fatty-acyl-phospholipid synthase